MRLPRSPTGAALLLAISITAAAIALMASPVASSSSSRLPQRATMPLPLNALPHHNYLHYNHHPVVHRELGFRGDLAGDLLQVVVDAAIGKFIEAAEEARVKRERQFAIARATTKSQKYSYTEWATIEEELVELEEMKRQKEEKAERREEEDS